MSFKARNFREWCNNTLPVLPEVYGDELSYYELLNKVIEKLNAMGVTVNELVEYVNSYFDSKDWQQMVNNKLDAMVADGTLDSIINQKIFGKLNNQVQTNTTAINNLDTQVKSNTTAINNLDTQVKSNTATIDTLRTHKKIVFIGDSYAEGYTPDGSVVGWPTVIKNGVPSFTIYEKYEGGAGIVNDGNNGNTFETLLTQLATTLSAIERNSISHVVIAGGYNDNNASYEALKNGVISLSKKARELFPNARLYYCIIGWTTNSGIRNGIRTMATRLTTNIPEAIELNVITSTMLGLHEYTFFSSDGIHPNQAGQNNIANAILRVINGENTLHLYDYQGGNIPKEDLINTAESPDNPNFISYGCSINNGILSLTIEGRIRAKITESPTPIASLQAIPYIRNGWNEPPIVQWLCWLQGWSDENKWVCGIGFLKIGDDGKLYVFHRITDDSGYAKLNFTKSSSFCNIMLSGAICNSYDL